MASSSAAVRSFSCTPYVQIVGHSDMRKKRRSGKLQRIPGELRATRTTRERDR